MVVVFTIHRHESSHSQWEDCTAWEKPESEVRQPYTLVQLRRGSQGWKRWGGPTRDRWLCVQGSGEQAGCGELVSK